MTCTDGYMFCSLGRYQVSKAHGLLLQGPENTSSLIGVILRFRVKSVAVAADIKRMFHQVLCLPKTGALFAICGGRMEI